jgi:hypothetical protein
MQLRGNYSAGNLQPAFLAIVVNGFKMLEDDVKIVKVDQKNDLCLLYRENHNLKPLNLVGDYNKNVKFGEEVWILGAPRGMMMSWQS